MPRYDIQFQKGLSLREYRATAKTDPLATELLTP